MAKNRKDVQSCRKCVFLVKARREHGTGRLGQGLLLEHHMAPIGILIAISLAGIKSQTSGERGESVRLQSDKTEKVKFPLARVPCRHSTDLFKTSM